MLKSQIADRKSQNDEIPSRDRDGAAGHIERQAESQIADRKYRKSQIHYLVMEYLEGETVADHVKKDALEPGVMTGASILPGYRVQYRKGSPIYGQVGSHKVRVAV